MSQHPSCAESFAHFSKSKRISQMIGFFSLRKKCFCINIFVDMKQKIQRFINNICAVFYNIIDNDCTTALA